MIKSVGPITLDGPQAADLAFRSLSFSESLSTPFTYSMEVLTDKTDLDPNLFLGQVMTAHLEIEGQDPRHFNGHVTEFVLLGSIGENLLYRMTLRPWLWLLQRAVNCRIFQNKSIPDIALEVFRAHGFSDIELRFSTDHKPREFVVQYRESDFNFVNRWLETEGIYYFFKHEASKHLLVLCDSPAAHEAGAGAETLEFFPPDPNRRALFAHVDRWQVGHRVESGIAVLRDFDFEAPTADLEVFVAKPASHDQAGFEVYDYPGGYVKPDPGNAYVKIRHEELQAGHSRAEARCNARGLSVGNLFTLAKHPIGTQNKQYLVLSEQGMIQSHSLESGNPNTGEDVFRCTFTCMDKTVPFRPPRRTPRPVVHGAQTAVVVGKKGEEIWTDKYGRVKLKFHWDRDSPGDENSSCWVRVAQVWAGTNWGAMHIPRMGQEVIVEFLEGDPDKPIVTGRVYNLDHMPPYELPTNQTQSGIKSRSTLGGKPDNFNEIRFEDKKGSEELFIQAEKTQTTKVKGSQSISVSGSRSVSVGGTQNTSVTKKETQTYMDEREMTVTKTNTETITLAHKGTYKQGRTLDVSGQDDKLDVATNRVATIKGNYHIQADKEYKVTHKTNTITLKDTKTEITNGKGKLTLDGGKLTLESPESVTIKCGGSTITLTPDSISVAGVKIGLAGGDQGKLDLDATGAQMSGPKAIVSGTANAQVTAPVVKVN